MPESELPMVDARPLDGLVRDLQRLRVDTGDPSFAEIARRIAARREAEGVAPAAARVARSSVHAMFILGRKRLNDALLAEIVLALTDDTRLAQKWQTRYRAAQLAQSGNRDENTGEFSRTSASTTSAVTSTRSLRGRSFST